MLTNSFYRQNQNTFDACSLALQPRPELEIQVAHIWRFDDVFFRDFEMNSQVAQVAWTEKDRLRASAYTTQMDYDTRDSFDRATYGLRVAGPWRLDRDWALHYALEYASQEDREENSFAVDADYLVAELGFVRSGYLVYLGYNQVSGVNNAGTEQPFDQAVGYPYPYRGETESFVVTPSAGMEIWMLRALGPIPGCEDCRFLFHAHRFGQETGSLTYGTDLGLALSYRPKGQDWSAFLKLAHFEQDDAGAGFASRTRLVFGSEITF